MATIQDTNLVLDEQIDVQPDDNDILLDAALITTLGGLGVADIGGGTDPTTGFPQVAVNTALLDTTGATALALSTVDGTSSGLFTVDGVEIFLYNENGIIYGREADANGDLAFAVALDDSDLSSAQIYLIQYEALQHNVPGDPPVIDDDDILSFADGKIILDVTTTEIVTTFQTLDFAAIPSGSPQETLTVATVDPTDNHSAKFDGIIFPGSVANPTTINTNPGTNDDLNPDAIGFGVKGGQASQMNQNEGFFVQDAAWTASSPDANEIGGIRFDIQAVGGVKSVNIEWWTVDNGAVIDHGTDKVSLPSGSAVFENYTIEPTDSVDQIYVRFSYDTKISTSGVRIENLEVAFPSSTEVTVVNHEDLGTHLVFEDAGPTFDGIIAGDTTPFQVGLQAGQQDIGTFDLTPGADGSHVTITGYTDLGGTDITETLTNGGTTLTYHDVANNQDLYQLNVTDSDYTFDVLFTPHGEQSDLNFNAVKSGGPQETLTVPTVDNTGSIVFDGLIFNTTPAPDAAKAAFAPFNAAPLGGPTVAADDLNPDAVGFGVKGGQASQINNNEGFTFHTADHSDINNLTFAVAGIGNINAITVESWLYDDAGNLIDHNTDNVTGLRSGNQTVTINDDNGGQAFDTAYVQFIVPGANSGVRILDFSTSIEGPVPDQAFAFTLTNTDLDGDAATQTLNILASQDYIV